MKNENIKSGLIKTQKIKSEAIVKYTMQSNLLQNLILNLSKDLKNQSKTETEYNKLIESFLRFKNQHLPIILCAQAQADAAQTHFHVSSFTRRIVNHHAIS